MKNKNFILGLCCFLLCASVFGQNINRYYDTLMEKGQYTEAILEIEKQLKKLPHNEELLRSMGYAHIGANKPEAGEKYYRQALEVNPKCARCYYHIGRTWYLRNDSKKASEYFDKAVNTDPNDAFLYSERAKLKQIMGDNAGAMLDHDKAVSLAPDEIEYLLQRADYNAGMGMESMALMDVNKAIDLAPDNYYVWYQRSKIYYGRQMLPQALRDINKAISLDSTRAELYTGRGAVLDASREYQQAVESYSKAIALDKNDYLNYYNRSSSYYSLENMDASCADLQYLKQNVPFPDSQLQQRMNMVMLDICDPARPSYYYQRGIAFYNLQQYQKAAEMYDQGLKLFPNHGMIFSFKGNALLALEKYDEAIKAYKLSIQHSDQFLEEVKKSPRHVGVSEKDIHNFHQGALATDYYNMAKSMLHTGSFEEAQASIDKALELAPSMTEIKLEEYHDMRGFILMARGKYDQAIVAFDKSIELNRHFAGAYLNRAVARVCLTQKIRTSSFGVGGHFNQQPMAISWMLPAKSKEKTQEPGLIMAMNDCSRAIELDKTIGNAYLVRGQIKQMLGMADYCLDLITAREMAVVVDAELLKNCK